MENEPPLQDGGELLRSGSILQVYLGRDADFDTAVREMKSDILEQRYGEHDAWRMRQMLNYLRLGVIASRLRYTLREEYGEWGKIDQIRKEYEDDPIAQYHVSTFMSDDTFPFLYLEHRAWDPPRSRESFTKTHEHLYECLPCVFAFLENWRGDQDGYREDLGEALYRRMRRERHANFLADLGERARLSGGTQPDGGRPAPDT